MRQTYGNALCVKYLYFQLRRLYNCVQNASCFSSPQAVLWWFQGANYGFTTKPGWLVGWVWFVCFF